MIKRRLRYVKIVKCSYYGYWYAGHVGEIFPVYRDKERPQYWWEVATGAAWIQRKDTEIVNITEVSNEQ